MRRSAGYGPAAWWVGFSRDWTHCPAVRLVRRIEANVARDASGKILVNAILTLGRRLEIEVDYRRANATYHGDPAPLMIIADSPARSGCLLMCMRAVSGLYAPVLAGKYIGPGYGSAGAFVAGAVEDGSVVCGSAVGAGSGAALFSIVMSDDPEPVPSAVVRGDPPEITYATTPTATTRPPTMK